MRARRLALAVSLAQLLAVAGGAFAQPPEPGAAAQAPSAAAPASGAAGKDAGAAPADAVASAEELAAERARLEAAVAAEPTAAAPRLRLADLLAQTGDVDGAVAGFQKAAELATTPDDLTAAHLALAILERQQSADEEAVAQYQLALQTAPTEPMALEGAATLLAQLGRYRDAIPFYGRLIAADPSNRQSWAGGASALILAGEYARAKIVLEQALAAFPDDLDLLDVLARHLAACPDHDVRDGKRAAELAEKLVDKVPTAESHETLAMAYAQAGQLDRAADEQQELIRRFGGDVDAATATRWRANLERYRQGRTCCAGE
jgi:tetratricopeptide (TPR) repeat protein